MERNNSHEIYITFQEIEENIKRSDVIEHYIYKKLSPNKYEQEDIIETQRINKMVLLMSELIPQWV